MVWPLFVLSGRDSEKTQLDVNNVSKKQKANLEYDLQIGRTSINIQIQQGVTNRDRHGVHFIIFSRRRGASSIWAGSSRIWVCWKTGIGLSAGGLTDVVGDLDPIFAESTGVFFGEAGPDGRAFLGDLTEGEPGGGPLGGNSSNERHPRSEDGGELAEDDHYGMKEWMGKEGREERWV